jgi:hypothetical protein
MWITIAGLLSLLLGQPPVWRLDDQFGRSHSAVELAGKPVPLIAGGAAWRWPSIA